MIKFYAQTQDYLRSVGILITKESQSQTRQVVKPVLMEFEEKHEHDFTEEPSIRLSKEEAQNLIDALWYAGIRPTEFNSPNGEINRLEAHLNDMGSLVFNKELSRKD